MPRTQWSILLPRSLTEFRSWWMLPWMNLSLALGWHLEQVAIRLALFTIECGSEAGSTLWNPWQLAQLAAVVEPILAAMPW